MVTYSEVVSTIALGISLFSSLVALKVALRDRPKLKAKARFIIDSEHSVNRISIVFVNEGRRPIILRILGGNGANGSIPGFFLDDTNREGVRLGENERFEYSLEKHNIFYGDALVDFFVDLWVEDSVGVRHPISGARKALEQLVE